MHRNGMILVFNDDASSGGHLAQATNHRPFRPTYGRQLHGSYEQALARG